ncbi:MAG TPA: DNA alkylation repair protein [Anaerolineales bacterium]|nr:DNA alkylation repair protein [Anaerolineales bacterium]
MPPIDPTRIRNQANQLVGLIGNPEQFVRSAHLILEAYTDYAFRQSEIVAQRAPFKGHNTPKPVLRQILNTLRLPIQQHPHLGFALACRLWQVNSHEERWLAGELLALCVPASPFVVQEQIENWLPSLENATMADALGLSAGTALLRVNPREFLGVTRTWLQSRSRWVRRFALASLMGLIQQRLFNDPSAIFDLIRSQMSENDAEIRAALAALLREMAANTPNEVARFLREWAIGMDRYAHLVVRQVLDAFDTATRTELLTLMRSNQPFSYIQ